MPQFEGDMHKDFGVSVPVSGSRGVFISFYFTDATIMDEGESRDKSTAPFHYPWGIHDGIKGHNVMLFNPNTKSPRSKLIRWAKERGVIPASVPAEGSADEISAAMAEENRKPFINVHTNTLPSAFISKVLVGYANHGLMDDLADVLGRTWRA